jgi:GNAT superfamily N-acetyltransferase
MATLTTTVTYLQMTDPGDLTGESVDDSRATFVEVRHCTNSFYLYLYTEVGRAWHWVERRRWSRERLRQVLDDPAIRIWTLLYDGCPAGYFELARDDEGGVEIAYFGLIPEFVGRGLGRQLLTTAVRTAWALEPAPSRVWLHTCTLDAPQALPNYIARGFRPYMTDEEVIETIDEPAV